MKIHQDINLTYKTDPYATHQPALIWALENSNKNILELGVGDSSTLLLHKSIKNNSGDLNDVSVDDRQKRNSHY